jgi:hypothetical protein
MAYAGYLLKVNGVIIPNKYILMGSYKPTPHQETDLDSYLDGDGYLDRSVLPHDRTKIEFNTIPYMTLSDKMEMQTLLPTSRKKRIKLTVEYWDDENNSYDIGDFYVPPIEYIINDASDTDIIYDSLRIALIQY